MAERRKRRDRRGPAVPTLKVFKRKERRGDERRDWPRKEVAFDVKERGGKKRSCRGDLSVEGAAFVTLTPPWTDEVTLTFWIPTFDGPIVAPGRVVSRFGQPDGTQVSVAFKELDVDAQLAIAAWFHDLQAVRTEL